MRNLKISVVLLLMTFAFTSNAQLRGLSYTLSPTGEYVRFGEKSGLQDSYLVGGQFGFGFGQNVELSANYQQGINFKTDNSRFHNVASTAFGSNDVKFRRYGGEIKLNLTRTAVRPYVAFGTGVQDVEREGKDQFSQIYTNAGAGLKFTALRRYTLGLQANASFYNMNPHETLLTAGELSSAGIALSDTKAELQKFYSLRASLIFNIGGRNPNEMTDLDVAYWENFSNGFRGVSLPIEPTLMKIDFSDKLNYRNQWFTGVQSGLDFGPMVGIRGYYMRGIEPKFKAIDEIALYGGFAKFKLNEGKGIVPFITLGGGYLNPLKGTSKSKEGLGFAEAGGGINIPFSKHFKVSGFVKTILTSSREEIEDTLEPNEITNSLAYGASVNFVFGGNRSNAKKLQKSKVEAALTEQELMYNQKVEALNAEIAKAKAEKDVEKVEDLVIAKEALVEEEIIEEEPVLIAEDAVEYTTDAAGVEEFENYEDEVSDNNRSIIRLTPAEFQLLLRDLLDQRGQAAPAPQFYPVPELTHSSQLKNNEYMENIMMKYDEKMARDMRRDSKNIKDELKKENNNLERRLLDKLNSIEKKQGDYNALLRKLERLERELEYLKKGK